MAEGLLQALKVLFNKLHERVAGQEAVRARLVLRADALDPELRRDLHNNSSESAVLCGANMLHDGLLQHRVPTSPQRQVGADQSRS